MNTELSPNDFDLFAPGLETAARFKNFHPPEREFSWSDGPWSEIVFPLPAEQLKASTTFDVVLDFDVFKSPPEMEGQNVFVYLNGLRLASRFITKRSFVNLRISGLFLRPVDNILTFDTPDSAPPKRFGIADPRCLGMQLFSIVVRYYFAI